MNKWMLFIAWMVVLAGLGAVLLFRFWKYLDKGDDDNDDEILGI